MLPQSVTRFCTSSVSAKYPWALMVLCCLALGHPAAANAQMMPPMPSRFQGSSIWVAQTRSEALPDPRVSTVHTFVQEVTYETTQANMVLGLEIAELSKSFSDIEIRAEHIGFVSMVPLSGPGDPGMPAGPGVFTGTSGPYPIVTNITNMRVTANIRVTIVLANQFALAGSRSFILRYSLY